MRVVDIFTLASIGFDPFIFIIAAAVVGVVFEVEFVDFFELRA